MIPILDFPLEPQMAFTKRALFSSKHIFLWNNIQILKQIKFYHKLISPHNLSQIFTKHHYRYDIAKFENNPFKRHQDI